MDNRLVLAVVLAVFAWMSVGTSAQTIASMSNTTASMSNMTTASMSNMTTASMSNMTTASMNNMTTASMSNMTTASMSNMTTASMSNMTTASMSNMTTASMSNMTTASMSNMTTASMSNMTTASMSNMTTASMSNMTTAAGGNNTMNANTTAAPTTTTAAPLTFNDTVVPLLTNISKAMCGSSQLCAAQPSDCDPSMDSTCFFISTKQTSGQNFVMQLSGMSDGYVAAILSPDTTLGGNDTTYVCANNNGTVQFFGALLSNSVLTLTTLKVNSVKGAISGKRIQCTFAVTIPDATVRSAASTSFSMAVATGTFTNGTLGAPKAQLQTNIVNLANPKANITDVLNNATTTTATPTTASSHAITLRHSLSQALLIILGVLGLSIL